MASNDSTDSEVGQACRSVVNLIVAKTIKIEAEAKREEWRRKGKVTLQNDAAFDDGNNAYLCEALDEMEIDLICEQLSQTLKAPTEIESPSIKFGDEQTEDIGDLRSDLCGKVTEPAVERSVPIVRKSSRIRAPAVKSSI